MIDARFYSWAGVKTIVRIARSTLVLAIHIYSARGVLEVTCLVEKSLDVGPASRVVRGISAQLP